MSRAESLRFETSSGQVPRRELRIASLVLVLASTALFLIVLRTNFQGTASSRVLVATVVLVLVMVIFLHARFLVLIRLAHRKTELDLQTAKEEMDFAEKQLVANKTLAQSASAEAEALRSTTFMLTQDLQMNSVLDTLLRSLAGLIPFESAGILLLEDALRLFTAREKLVDASKTPQFPYPLTLDASDFPLLKRVLMSQEPVLLSDTHVESTWRDLRSGASVRCWLCVPLVAAHQSVGALCIDHSQPFAFSERHLRLATSLSLSATAAIQNARLYERAEIYGSELERRVSELRTVHTALEQAKTERMISEEKFQNVFRSSPIAFCITTLDGGRFLDVNKAFEQRYCYSRSELIGHSVHELRIWENSTDRELMITRLKRGGAIRNMIALLRSKTGELKLTAYSADRIQFEGENCVLAVSGDVPRLDSNLTN